MNLCLMSRYLTELDDELCWFPPSHALEEPNGLLAIGGISPHSIAGSLPQRDLSVE